MSDFVGALDQGTTSTRFFVFDHAGTEVARSQLEHRQILPGPGRVEHDPMDIWTCTEAVIGSALRDAGLSAGDLAAVGVTNQRETTVVWDPRTGRPYHNAIVWQDMRTATIAAALRDDGRGEVIRDRTGLLPAPYFSGGKLQWLLENTPGLRAAAERGDAVFGTVDSWLTWKLTGGPRGGRHVTDVTNASRTMLMSLDTLDWDEELLSFFGIPRRMLPEIVPSADPEAYGRTQGIEALGGDVVVGAALGDQQAAMVGQACFDAGDAKNTYGTGNFVLLNTGSDRVASKNGGLTTICYQFAGSDPVFALEGSVAVTGAAVHWLRDQLGVIEEAAEVEALAAQVPDNGGVYFVPAFSGLYAPHWRSDARGTIVGLSRYNSKAHLARATLEAICYQSLDVIEALERDVGTTIECLKVDGGITSNRLCMQLQADILGLPVVRPAVSETTALGAAYAAGLATRFWSDLAEVRANWTEGERWTPTWSEEQRARGDAGWRRALDRAVGWVE